MQKAPLPAHWTGYRVPSGRGGGWGEGGREGSLRLRNYLWHDDLEEFVLAVGDLDQRNRLRRDSATRRVGDSAGDPLEALRRRQRVANSRTVDRTGASNGVGHQLDAVVTEGSEHRFRRFAVLALVGRVEGFRDRRLVVDALVSREVDIRRRVPTQLGQERRVITVAADDRHLQTQVARLSHDRSDLSRIGRDEDEVWLRVEVL